MGKTKKKRPLHNTYRRLIGVYLAPGWPWVRCVPYLGWEPSVLLDFFVSYFVVVSFAVLSVDRRWTATGSGFIRLPSWYMGTWGFLHMFWALPWPRILF